MEEILAQVRTGHRVQVNGQPLGRVSEVLVGTPAEQSYIRVTGLGGAYVPADYIQQVQAGTVHLRKVPHSARMRGQRPSHFGTLHSLTYSNTSPFGQLPR